MFDNRVPLSSLRLDFDGETSLFFSYFFSFSACTAPGEGFNTKQVERLLVNQNNN